MTKSVEATRAHLQGQLRNKEAENNRLTVQLRVQTPSISLLLSRETASKTMCDILAHPYGYAVFSRLWREP